MNVEVHALASGSSGNATLITADGISLLIDAGVSGRALCNALRQRGVKQGSLKAILLTHEHDDHLRGAADVSARFHAPVIANRGTLSAASDRVELRSVVEMETGSEFAISGMVARSFAVSHDAAEPVGYVVEAGDVRIAYATDLGVPNDDVRAAMRGANLCIVESNHDKDWLWRGPYPPQMKARIASNVGHLSNLDAANLIAERLEGDGPASFWLAHLSAVNNSPALARRFVREEVRARTPAACSIEVALRDRPSLVWRPAAFQMSLF
jgi:phosphoribosyl 1,2-cyclic phosphodiesterase